MSFIDMKWRGVSEVYKRGKSGTRRRKTGIGQAESPLSYFIRLMPTIPRIRPANPATDKIIFSHSSGRAMEKPKHSNPATKNMTGALERLFNAITPFPCTRVRFESIISLSPKLTRPLLPQLREKIINQHLPPLLSLSPSVSPAQHHTSLSPLPMHQTLHDNLGIKP